MIKTIQSRAETSTDHDFINWNRQHFPQYQKHWANESTLNQTPSDDDPLRATLTIKEKSSLTFYMTYCDLRKEEDKAADKIVEYFAKLSPSPDFCILQNVQKQSIVEKVYDCYNTRRATCFQWLKFAHTCNCFGITTLINFLL